MFTNMFTNFKNHVKTGLEVLASQGPKVFFTKLIQFLRKKWKRVNLPEKDRLNITHILSEKFEYIAHINTLYSNELTENKDQLRINLITDSLNDNSLYGGVATTVVFAVLLANKLEGRLRIITRIHSNAASTFLSIAKMHHIPLPAYYEFYCSTPAEKQALPVTKNDVFIASSWWSAYPVQQINLRKKYISLIQEYEKIFHPNGDEHVFADAIFKNAHMIPVINTHILQDFFNGNNYSHIRQNSLVFEPAFPYVNFSPKTKQEFIAQHQKKEKRTLLFYARPTVPRNLFYTGLNLLNTAIEQGILETKDWQIFFAGHDNFPVRFCDGSKPVILGKMNLNDYSDFISGIDLGLSLMLAPCPSYVPLDLACAGAVVLTNSYKNKTRASLEKYSKNIICAEPEEKSLLDHLEKALALSQDYDQRYANYLNNAIAKNWQESLSPLIEKLVLQII